MSGKYSEGRQAFGEGDLSWTRDTIVAQLVSSAYSHDAGHSARDVKGVGEPVTLAEKSIEGGWAKCARLVFRQVDGERVAGIVFRRDGGKATLIFYSNDVANFPMQPNGGDIEVDIPERGIFQL